MLKSIQTVMTLGINKLCQDVQINLTTTEFVEASQLRSKKHAMLNSSTQSSPLLRAKNCPDGWPVTGDNLWDAPERMFASSPTTPGISESHCLIVAQGAASSHDTQQRSDTVSS